MDIVDAGPIAFIVLLAVYTRVRFRADVRKFEKKYGEKFDTAKYSSFPRWRRTSRISDWRACWRGEAEKHEQAEFNIFLEMAIAFVLCFFASAGWVAYFHE